MATANFFAAGGIDELGKNMYVIEVNQKMYLFDCGTKVPESGRLGIDTIVPNINFFKKNKTNIVGLFVSNGQEQVIAGIPHLFRQLQVDIYCSNTTAFLIKSKLIKAKMQEFFKFIKIIKPKQQLKFPGDVKIEPFAVTCSLPGGFGYALTTEDGNFIYISDFIFDTNDLIARNLDMRHLASIVNRNKTIALFTGSQNASKNSFTAPNHTITKWIEWPFIDAKNRIIVFAYEEMLYNILEVIKLANRYNKKIVIRGKTCLQLLQSLRQTNPILKKARFIDGENLTVEEEKNVVIIIADRWESLYPKMEQIGIGNNKKISIKETDTVLVTSVPQPGVERLAAGSLDEIAKNECSISLVPRKKHFLLNPGAEDIKLMANILQPKVFVPIKGLFKNMKAAADLFTDYKDITTLLISNGEMISFQDGELVKKRRKVNVGQDVMVDGGGIGHVGVEIIHEREMLSRDGVVVLGIMLDRNNNHKLVGDIDIQMRGVVYVDEKTNELFNLLKERVANVIDDYLETIHTNKTSFVNREATNVIRRKTMRVVLKNTKKSPMVIPVIIEV